MGLASEFKEFAMKGSVVDLAVGVVIGGAFGKIVSSLVADIIMPPIGLAIGGVNFADLAVQIGTSPKGLPVLFKYGMFIQQPRAGAGARALHGDQGHQPPEAAEPRDAGAAD